MESTSTKASFNAISQDPPRDPKLLIMALRTGRLANRLVLFSNFIGFAEAQGHRLWNVTFHSFSKLFPSTARNIYCRYPPPPRKSWLDQVPGMADVIRSTRIFYHFAHGASILNEKLPVLFNRRAVTLREPRRPQIGWLDGPEIQNQIRTAKIVFANGWRFRAPECVRKHAEKIRDYFKPCEHIEQASRNLLVPLREKAEIVVGVHIRHGDYRTWRGGACFFPASRYVAWMRELEQQFSGKKIAFLVCSDEARDRREFPGLAVHFGSSPVVDLFALAACDYILGPPSTFSQWASFYGNAPLFHIDNAASVMDPSKFSVSWLNEIP